MRESPQQRPCICLSLDDAHVTVCPRSLHGIPGLAAPSGRAEYQQQHLIVSRSRSRSHPIPLRPADREPMKATVEIPITSLDPAASYNPLDHLFRDKTSAGRKHRKAKSAIVHPSVQIQPLSPTTVTPLQPSCSRIDAFWDLLPGEVRNRVYEALLASCSNIIDLHANRTYNMTATQERQAHLKLLPSLAYVNRETYSEFTTFLFEKKTLSVRTLSDLYYLEEVLDSFPGQKGWNSVRSIQFLCFSDMATSPARARELFDCVSRCRNIEKLTLQVKLDQLHMPNGCPAYRQCSFLNDTPWIRSSEQVAADYELGMLFELPRLHTFTMICRWHCEGPVRCTPRTMITFWDLEDWIGQGFAIHARNIKEVAMSVPFNEPKKLGAWTIRLDRPWKEV